MPNDILDLDKLLEENQESINLDEVLTRPKESVNALKEELSFDSEEGKVLDLDTLLETPDIEEKPFMSLEEIPEVLFSPGKAAMKFGEGALKGIDYAMRPIRAAVAIAASPTTEEIELSDIPEILTGKKFKTTGEILRPIFKEYDLEEKLPLSKVLDYETPEDAPFLAQASMPTRTDFMKKYNITDEEMANLGENELTIDLPETLGIATELAVMPLAGKAAVSTIKYTSGILKGISPTIATTIGRAEAPLTQAISVIYGNKPEEVSKDILRDSLKVDILREAAEAKKARRLMEKGLQVASDETGNQSASILNVWDKKIAPQSYVFNKIDRIAGTNVTKEYRKILDAVHRVDSELPKVNKFFNNRLARLKTTGVDMEEATELLSQFGYEGAFSGNKGELLKKLGGDEEAFKALVDMRKGMDGMYNDIASTRFSEMTSEVEKLINVSSVSQKYRDLINKNFERMSKILNEDARNVQKYSGDNAAVLEVLLEGLPKTDKEARILKQYITETVENLEEFRYVDKYIRSQVKKDYLYDYIHRLKKKPRAEQLIRSKLETPGLMKEKKDLIPEYQLEKNLEKVLDRYSRSYLDYKYMRPSMKGLQGEIQKLRNIPLMAPEEIEPFMNSVVEAISAAAKNKKYENFFDDIYENTKRVLGRKLESREKTVLNDFFNKYEDTIREVQKTRNVGNVDKDLAESLLQDINGIKEFLKEAPETVAETAPALVRKLRALKGQVVKDIPNKNLALRIEHLIDEVETRVEAFKIRGEVVSPEYTKNLSEELVKASDTGLAMDEIKWIGEAPQSRPGELLEALNPYDKVNLAELENKVPSIISEKLDSRIEDTIRWARGYYDKVDEKVVRQGELIRVLDNGEKEGELIDIIKDYMKGGTPVITTDASKYVGDWIVDALGYGSREESVLSGRIKNTLKRFFPKNTKLGKALTSILEDMGMKINPRADWDDLADVLRTEVYSNAMGFRLGNVIRNTVQPFLFTLPQLNVGVIDKAIVTAKLAKHWGNPVSWKEFSDTALKSDFILSDIDKAKKSLFDREAASKLFGIKTGKIIGDVWNAKNKTGMFLYNMADMSNRFNSYWMAKEAASRAVRGGRKSVLKMLNPAYIKVGDRRALLNILDTKGTESFIQEYSKLLTNQTQFIYKNIERSPFLRNKLLRTIIMFSKFPIEVVSREAHYIGELFRGNPTGLKGVAQDFMYGLALFEIGKMMGLDLSNMHLMSSMGLPAQHPVIRAAYEATSGETDQAMTTMAEAYTPIPAVVKSVNQIVGKVKNRNRAGLYEYREGEVPRYYKLSPLGLFRQATESSDDEFFK